MLLSRFNIGQIAISRTDLQNTIFEIENALNLNQYGYICVTNSRTTYLANHDSDYCRIQNDSFLTVPDGAPLIWIAKKKGFKEVGKVSGKDLMDTLFEISVEKGYSHYFYGSTPETIKRIKSKLENEYPKIVIKGILSPPFQSIDEFDIEAIACEINKLKPTFFWCGLGAPKQEKLIANLQPLLNSTISIGVGLAFEYIAGTVKRAPSWMHNLGLEWFYRLMQQPKNIPRAIQPLSWIFLKLLSLHIKS